MNLVRIRARTHFDQTRLKKKVDEGTFRSLAHAGAAIRLTARRSIRRRKKPSRPGSPPHTPTGHLKRVLRYDVDRDSQEVVIGPVNEYSRTIWNLHEFGGSIRPKPRLVKAHTFRVGKYGPIRRSGATLRDRRGRFMRRSNQFARVQIRSEAQARRATQIVKQENEYRMADAKKRRRYPQRPFMGPALESQRSRLPRFWANSVRA
jgi:hypothetical protein